MRFVWVAECFPRVMYAGWWSGDQADDTAAIDSGPADSLTAADAAILGTTPRAHDDWRNTAAIVPVCRLGPMTVQSVQVSGLSACWLLSLSLVYFCGLLLFLRSLFPRTLKASIV